MVRKRKSPPQADGVLIFIDRLRETRADGARGARLPTLCHHYLQWWRFHLVDTMLTKHYIHQMMFNLQKTNLKCRLKTLKHYQAQKFMQENMCCFKSTTSRDLFDIHVLLNEQGITDKIRQALVVYLAEIKTIERNVTPVYWISKQPISDSFIE